jgi:hypothetical protein
VSCDQIDKGLVPPAAGGFYSIGKRLLAGFTISKASRHKMHKAVNDRILRDHNFYYLRLMRENVRAANAQKITESVDATGYKHHKPPSEKLWPKWVQKTPFLSVYQVHSPKGNVPLEMTGLVVP